MAGTRSNSPALIRCCATLAHADTTEIERNGNAIQGGQGRTRQRSRPACATRRCAIAASGAGRIRLVLVALAAWIAADFIPALAWAIVIAITTWPLYLRFAALIPKPLSHLVAPALFTVVVGIVLLIPLMLALQQVAQASDAAAHWIAELQKGGVPVPTWVAQLPLTGDLFVEWWRRT